MVTIPEIGAGDYFLILKTDGQNQIGELSEANNVWVVPIRGTLPDLMASGLGGFGEALAGRSVQVPYSVTN